MRKTLAVAVATISIGAFLAPGLASADCSGMHTADKGGQTVASSTPTDTQTPKPVQQTQVPTEQAN
jgi:hypothetical protein